MSETEIHGFLGALTEPEVKSLKSRASSRWYRRGALLFTEGEGSEHAVVIARGRVKVVSPTASGSQRVLSVRGPGEIIGEISALDGGTRSASVEAMTEVEALVVPAEAFRRFLADRPRAAIVLLEDLASRFRYTTRKRLEFGESDVTGRVAKRLVELVEAYGEPVAEGIRISLPITQEELAGWTAASRVAVARSLGTLRRKNIIVTSRRKIVVLDVEGLERRATA